MNATEIRQSFLEFFAEQGHKIVPSAPVFPKDDPTLMFTNAGMNQFKPFFLGQAVPPTKRVCDSQKCIRVSGKHNDLEEVGLDTYHHTLFEMLGNWSFGDYYKKEAITWAWKLLTERWKLPKERLYASVFGGDEKRGLPADTEAEKYWREVTDIDPTHIMRFGAKDNFWMMGDVGPCGPCSEIHIDLTPDCSGGKLVNVGDPLVMELWNLVFMEFNASPEGLKKLPACNVDTGAGLDRIAAVMECTENCTRFDRAISNYDTSLFSPIIKKLEELSGRTYTKGQSRDRDSIAMRVCADHLRMVAFSIADGALPSNEGRGYVIRRILRRAARYGRQIGLTEPFLYNLLPTLIEVMGTAYPELVREQAKIERVIKSEENSFHQTLDRGIALFEEEAAALQAGQTFPGETAFRLYDTFGFPFDLTEVMAKERGLSVDEASFKEHMQAQKERARAARVKTAQIAEDEKLDLEATVFVGYDQDECETEVAALIGHEPNRALVLKQSPFYGEMGGQVGDTGTITVNGQTLRIVDTKQREGVVMHMLEPGLEISVKAGDKAVAAIDSERRRQSERHHTATHLLHHALRQVMGSDVHQQGSLVAPDRLRFDFTCTEAIGKERIAAIEKQINAEILANTGVAWFEIPYSEKPDSVIAFFGDKYGNTVRVINVGGCQASHAAQPAYDGFSIELCGGCHCKRTGDIGMFKIVSESAIAAGVRRIEAVAGSACAEYLNQAVHALDTACEVLHSPRPDLTTRIEALLDTQKKLERELAEAKQAVAKAQAGNILDQVTDAEGIPVLALDLGEAAPDYLRQMADELKQKFNGVALLGGRSGAKVNLLALVTPDFVKQGFHAGNLVKEAAKRLGGGGGGRPDMAQAGAKDAAKLPEVLGQAAEIVKSQRQ